MLKTQDLNESQLRNRAVARMVLNGFDSTFKYDEEKVHRNHGDWTGRASWSVIEGFRQIFERNQKADARARIQNAYDTAQELFLPHYDLVVPSFFTFLNESKKQVSEIANLRMKFTNSLINALRPEVNKIDQSFQSELASLQVELQKALEELRVKLQKEVAEKEAAISSKEAKLDSEIQSLQGIFR